MDYLLVGRVAHPARKLVLQRAPLRVVTRNVLVLRLREGLLRVTEGATVTGSRLLGHGAVG